MASRGRVLEKRREGMTKSEATALREEIQTAVDAVLVRHGMARTKTTLSYGDAEGRVSLQFATGTSSTEARHNQCAAEWEQYADLLRLDKSWLNTTVQVNGESMTIVGLNMRNRKYPVIVENRQGKRYKVGELVVRVGKGEVVMPRLSLGEPMFGRR